MAFGATNLWPLVTNLWPLVTVVRHAIKHMGPEALNL